VYDFIINQSEKEKAKEKEKKNTNTKEKQNKTNTRTITERHNMSTNSPLQFLNSLSMDHDKPY